jgi:hypothetical protein
MRDRPVGAAGLAGEAGLAEPADTGGQLAVAPRGAPAGPRAGARSGLPVRRNKLFEDQLCARTRSLANVK